ncbi:pyrroline-5-carboxylate reductase, partial [Kipferlia bialata]
GLAPLLSKDTLVVSILAGTTCAVLEKLLGSDLRVVRAMPNTPMMISEGMVGIAKGTNATDTDLDMAEVLFSAAAKVLRVAEPQLDALTAVSGSGPAYLFRFAEAQVAAAKELGFSDEDAALLVGQTIRGSINYLMSEMGFPAGTLRKQVTSPGGTTAAALDSFNDDGISEMVKRAFFAARDRSIELARQAETKVE